MGSHSDYYMSCRIQPIEGCKEWLSFRSRFSFTHRRRYEISVGHQPIRQLDSTQVPRGLSPLVFLLHLPRGTLVCFAPQSPEASRRAAGEEEASTPCWSAGFSRSYGALSRLAAN